MIKGKTIATYKCPYCKNFAVGAKELVKCAKCKTVHHLQCWQENQQCSVFGCEGKEMLSRIRLSSILEARTWIPWALMAAVFFATVGAWRIIHFDLWNAMILAWMGSIVYAHFAAAMTPQKNIFTRLIWDLYSWRYDDDETARGMILYG